MSEDPGDQKKLSAIRSKTLDVGSSDRKTLGKPLSYLTQDALVVDARSTHWETLEASVSSHQKTLGARGSHRKTLMQEALVRRHPWRKKLLSEDPWRKELSSEDPWRKELSSEDC